MIGALISHSGFGSQMIEVTNGMNLAVQELNNHGGIAGSPLEVIIEDTESNPDVAIDKFQQIEKNHKPVLYTSTLSSVSLALSQHTEKAHVPLITLVSTNPNITKDKEWVFSFFPSAKDEIPPVLAVLRSHSVDAVGLLYHDDPYGLAIFEEMEIQSTAYDYRLLAVKYNMNQSDFSSFVTELMETDAVYAVGYASHLEKIFTELKNRKYPGIVIGPSTASIPSMRGKPIMEGVYVAAPIIYKSDYKFSKRVEEKYEQTYNEAFTHYAATGYEFINLAAGLLEKIDLEKVDVDRTKLKQELDKGFIYPGIFGDSILKPGERIISFQLYPAKIKNGSIEYGM